MGEGEAVLYRVRLIPLSRDSCLQTASCVMSGTFFFPRVPNLLCFKAKQKLPVLKSSIFLLLEQRILKMQS